MDRLPPLRFPPPLLPPLFSVAGVYRIVSTPSADLAAKIKAAKERLDAHVREIVEWHFNPATGSPFWLEKARTLGFDPRKEVYCFEDLRKFPEFEDEWLRGGPIQRWIPQGLKGKPVYVFETGGTTGIPKSRMQID